MERDLLTKAKHGNKEALVQLIMIRQDDYYRLALAYLRNRDDALDAMQEMIVIIYENIKKLKDDTAFPSWSKTILMNTCKQILKKQKKVIPMDNVENVEQNPLNYTNHAITTDTKIDINNYLDKLNDKQKDAIILKYYLDLEYETIADITRTPVGTVKSRIFNGLKRLNQLLGGGYHG